MKLLTLCCWLLAVSVKSSSGRSFRTSLRSLDFARKVQATLSKAQRGWDDVDDQELDLSSIEPGNDIAAGIDVALQTLDGSSAAATNSLDSDFLKEAAAISPMVPADDFDRAKEVEKASTSAPTSTTSDDGGPELARLERSVLELVNQGATPGMVAFIEEVRNILDQKMRKEISQQHNATKQTLDAHFAALLQCSSQDDTPNNSSKLSPVAGAVNVSSRYNPSHFQLPELGKEHRSCRRVQTKLHQHAKEMDRLVGEAKVTMDLLCAYFAGNETSRSCAVGTAKDCVFSADRYPPANHNRYIDFLRDQLAWWDDQYQKIHRSRVMCQSAQEEWEQKKRSAFQAKEAYEKGIASCKEAQAKMDEASCSYKKALDEKCERERCCADTNWKVYNESLAQAKVEETFLKAQMRAVMRIHCYLGIFEYKNVSDGVEKCRAKDFTRDPNVTAMMFVGRTKPNLTSCDYDLADVVGYCAYEDKYYGNTSGLSDPCSASCCVANASCSQGRVK